ncbi:hypothetical protein HN51_037321 [Arachis hypogaea]
MSTASSSSTSQNTLRRKCFFSPTDHCSFFSTLPVGDGCDFSGDPLAKPSPNTPRPTRKTFPKYPCNVQSFLFYLAVPPTVPVVEAFDFSGDPLAKPSPKYPCNVNSLFFYLIHLISSVTHPHVEERIVNLEKLLNKKSIQAELRKKTREAAAGEMEASSTKSND